MARLVEGDVGSGKTVVALAAMLGAVASGFQAVLMAPTEVLAEQHFRTICLLLSGEAEPPLNGMVSAAVPAAAPAGRAAHRLDAREGTSRRPRCDRVRRRADIVVGTHALIQDGVAFDDLGLSVVDEQHRFGVMQRAALREKGGTSAPARHDRHADPALARADGLRRPRPVDHRRVAAGPHADRDASGCHQTRRREAFAHMRREVEAGRQAFVICPLVEGSDTVASRAATEEYERLRTEEFPDLADASRCCTGAWRRATRTR